MEANGLPGFHALRHTFISNLARAGIHPRNAQALARHSTIDLTMNVYTHVAMDDLANDLEAMTPVLFETAAKPEKQVAPQPATAVPAELAALASNWADLPEHIRQAVAALAQS